MLGSIDSPAGTRTPISAGLASGAQEFTRLISYAKSDCVIYKKNALHATVNGRNGRK
jgi:hypothetical protein